jgi:hypothetical protein
MTTKLTLTLEREVIERAKIFARNSGRSLSGLIEEYLDIITRDTNREQLSPKLGQLLGAVKLPEGFDDKEEQRRYLEQKQA